MALFKKHRTAKLLIRTPWNDSSVFVPVNVTLAEAHRLIALYSPDEMVEVIGDYAVTRYHITPDIVVIIEETTI